MSVQHITYIAYCIHHIVHNSISHTASLQDQKQQHKKDPTHMLLYILHAHAEGGLKFKKETFLTESFQILSCVLSNQKKLDAPATVNQKGCQSACCCISHQGRIGQLEFKEICNTFAICELGQKFVWLLCMTVVQILQVNVVQEQQQQCSGSKASGIGEKGTRPML